MTADEFVGKLASIAPSIEHLLSRGYLPEIAEELRSSFLLEKKRPSPPIFDDPLVHLICNYDTSKFEIGALTLGKREFDFTPPPDKIHVGAIESDILVINPLTGAVELLDHAQPDYVMAKCAASGEQFLEALLLLAGYEAPYLEFTGKLTKEQAIANNEAIHKRAIECARVAGVSTRQSIYETLLGYDCWIV